MKKKNKTLKTIGITILVIIILVSAFFIFKSLTQQTGLPTDSESEDLSSFCSTVEGCVTYLESQGMPSNYLTDNGIEIICENGKCYATK